MQDRYFEAQFPEDTMAREIEKALSFIKTGVSCQIVGVPGSGKSTLLKLLAYNRTVRDYHLKERSASFHFVYLDFSEVHKRPLKDITKFFLISLSHSLTERRKIKEAAFVDDLFKKALQLADDELVLFRALKDAVEYLALEEELTLVFLIDRFELYLPDVTEQFFINLTILKELMHDRFSCIFSLPRPLDLLLDTMTFAEFHQYLAGNTVFIPINNTVGITYRIEYLEEILEKKLDNATEKEILSLTGGHNKLTRIAVEAVLPKKNPAEDLTSFLLQRRQMQRALEELWDFLTPHEKNHILHLKKGVKDEDIQLLQLLQLVQNNTLTIPFFASYIQTVKQKEKQEIYYDEEKNILFKGDADLTQQLTPLEFRLLRFLVINKEKVCEKNEIIEAVWSDTVSREGVTDQALDQIIYRLRKKIEPDPNNPQYLHTIKGKGIKLSR